MGLEIELIAPALGAHQPHAHEGPQLPLRGARARPGNPRQLAQVVPLLGLAEQKSQQLPAALAE
jgi:hypothetical protein